MTSNYIDENGYRRNKTEHSNLIHRNIAYHQIYLPNKEEYSLPFSKYQVHHKDKNKLNNRVSNLQLVTKEEHEAIHGIVKFNWVLKLIPILIVFGFIFSIIYEFGVKSIGAIIFSLIVICVVVGLYLQFKK